MSDYNTYKFILDGKERELKITTILDNDIKQLVYEMHNQDQDILIVFDGEEGSGKSHSLRQIGWLINHHQKEMFGVKLSFDARNVHYKVLDYVKTSWEHKENAGWINILDEGGDEIDRQSTISPEGKRYIRFMRKNRKLNQVHLVAMPAAHDLTKYIALWRMKFIIKMEKERVASEKSPTGRELQLGKFRVIRNDNRWKYCYMDRTPYKYPNFLKTNKTSKSKDGEYVKYNKDHRGRFMFCEVFTQKDLDELKRKNLEMAEETDVSEKKGRVIEDGKKYQIMLAKIKNPSILNKDIAKLVGCNPKYVSQVLNELG